MSNRRFATILVTGANGFVGRPLCQAVALRGLRVIALTRKPQDFGASIENRVIPNLLDSSIDWVSEFKNVDAIYHLAARVHLMHDHASDPLSEYRRVNVELTDRLVQAAISAGVRRFIYVSSIKVNGERTRLHHPFCADHLANPSDPYGVSKWEAEQAIQKRCQMSAMNYTIIRPPLVYGPGVGANFLALLKLLHYPMLLPFKSIENRRSLIGLDNLVDLLLCLKDNPGAKNQTFLVSDDEDLSTPQLLEKLATLSKARAMLVYCPEALVRLGLRAIGQKRIAERLCDSLQIDMQATKERLGWRPPLTVNEGLAKTVEYHESDGKATL
jgi:nucleoside-diphosphate-sugar epimerase